MFEITCFDEIYAECPTFQEALRTSENHIRVCQQGGLRFAVPIQWYYADQVHLWVSAARDEWLNHHIRSIT